jgi:hypothetical protein
VLRHARIEEDLVPAEAARAHEDTARRIVRHFGTLIASVVRPAVDRETYQRLLNQIEAELAGGEDLSHLRLAAPPTREDVLAAIASDTGLRREVLDRLRPHMPQPAEADAAALPEEEIL